MAAKLLLCFKPPRDRTPSTGVSTGTTDSGSTGTQENSRHTVAYVELLKHTAEPLGLALHGGKDTGVPVQVGVLRPGGVAAKSGALQVGDRILGINGTATQHLQRAEVNALLQNAGNVINLEIAFEGSEDDDSTLKKSAQITLPRERNSYGFTISGGKTENRPITVSNVTLDTTAYRNGFLKAGDRILKVNGVDLSRASQMDTLSLLKTSGETCTLEIQYDVTVHDVLSGAQGPLLVELLKPRGVSLGISIRRTPGFGEPLRISRIKEAGIADRCGALHVGDSIVSVNGQSLENKSLHEVYQMLKHCDLQVRLEIIPSQNHPDDPFADTQSYVSHLPSFSSRLSGRDSQLSLASTATSTNLTSHPESMMVSLHADEIGFGLSLQGGATDYVNYPLTISSIEEGGPAARLGQLQVGDHILSINGIKVDTATLQQAVKLVKEAVNLIDLEVMFDVQDAVMPTSGTFEVNLVKTTSLNLGITINGSHHPGDPIWISKLKKGGIAYRTGMLHSGDILLAINDVGLESCNLGEAAQMLKNTGDMVSLKVSKENMVPRSETIIYSVELHRNQQSLGITLTGSRDQQGKPIVISKIKEDGVAYKTGALKVGNRVLAINGASLINTTLPEAVHMLSSAGDVVNLKIRKATSRPRRGRLSPTGKVYRRGFHRPGSSARSRSGAPISRLSSRMEGQESYSRLLALRARRLSQTTTATTISGRSTPDNHSTLSIDQSSYNGSVYGQTEPTGRDSALGRLTPSEVGSAFSRPTSSASSASSFRVRRYGHGEMDPGDRYSLPQYSPGQISSVELQRRLRHEIGKGLLSKQESLTEADEEMPLSGWEDSASNYRRTSLSDKHSGSKKWDFKSRRNTSFSSPRVPIPVGRVPPLTSVIADSPFPEQLNSLNQELKKINLSPNNPDHPTLSIAKGSVSDPQTPPSVVTPTNDVQVNTQESTEGEDSGMSIIAKVCEGSRAGSKMSSVGSNSEDTERHGYTGGSSAGDGESQSAPTSPEPPIAELNTPTTLPCSTLVPQTGSTDLGEADEIPLEDHSPRVVSVNNDKVSVPEHITPDSSQNRSSPHLTTAVDALPAPAQDRSSPHMTTTVDVLPAPAQDRSSPHMTTTVDVLPAPAQDSSSPHITTTVDVLPAPAQDRSSPHITTTTVDVLAAPAQDRSSPHMTTTVDVLPTPAQDRSSPHMTTTVDVLPTPAQDRSSPHMTTTVDVLPAPAQDRSSPHMTTTVDVLPTPAQDRSSPHMTTTVDVLPAPAQDRSSPHMTTTVDVLPAPAQDRSSPHMTTTVDVLQAPAQDRSSPHMTTTVDVLPAPVSNTHDHSPGSPLRKFSTTSMEVAAINGHQVSSNDHTSTIATGPSALLVNNEVPRKKSAPEATQRKTSNPSTLLSSMSVPSFETTRSFNDFQQTIDKATEFELAIRALAESGSSDQDSDTEPHRAKPESVSASEQEKIQEKMRTTIPPNQLKVHRFVVNRRPGTSFGFSLADGLYDPGIYVKAVNVGSPADNAGVQPFDILLRIAGTSLQADYNCKKLDPILKQCGNYLELIVARQHQPGNGESYC